jgi:hypothetical protein
MLHRLHLPTIRRLYGDLMTRAEAIYDFNFSFQRGLKLQMLGSFLGPEIVHDK